MRRRWHTSGGGGKGRGLCTTHARAFPRVDVYTEQKPVGVFIWDFYARGNCAFGTRQTDVTVFFFEGKRKHTEKKTWQICIPNSYTYGTLSKC